MAKPSRPMFNRATYGEYAPGSIFKIINALALLEKHPHATQLFVPMNARRYLERLSAAVAAPIDIVSTGAERDDTILVRDPFSD